VRPDARKNTNKFKLGPYSTSAITKYLLICDDQGKCLKNVENMLTKRTLSKGGNRTKEVSSKLALTGLFSLPVINTLVAGVE
jgi:hypothetical protein